MKELNPILPVTIVVLEPLDSLVLAAANLALSLQKKIPPANLAFSKLLALDLIDSRGVACEEDSLVSALAFVINERVAARTFL